MRDHIELKLLTYLYLYYNKWERKRDEQKWHSNSVRPSVGAAIFFLFFPTLFTADQLHTHRHTETDTEITVQNRRSSGTSDRKHNTTTRKSFLHLLVPRVCLWRAHWLLLLGHTGALEGALKVLAVWLCACASIPRYTRACT